MVTAWRGIGAKLVAMDGAAVVVVDGEEEEVEEEELVDMIEPWLYTMLNRMCCRASEGSRHLCIYSR
jgi:hypothetical protein